MVVLHWSQEKGSNFKGTQAKYILAWGGLTLILGWNGEYDTLSQPVYFAHLQNQWLNPVDSA